MRVLIRPAGRSELKEVRELLMSLELPYEGFVERLIHLFIAQNKGRVIGCVGLESFDKLGLIRVLAVHPDFQDEDVGRQLMEHILDYARLNNMREIYAFAPSLSPYLEDLGFRVIDKEEIDSRIRELPDFETLCPETASCLKLTIERITDLG